MKIQTAPQTASINADPTIWKTAQSLEQSFLSEMLSSAGLGEISSDFGGGIGEEQFSSMLVDAQSEHLVRAGGLGLTEQFYEYIFNQIQEK